MSLRGTHMHRAILVRLVPVWLGLSLIVGAAVYWIESRHVDQFVYAIASQEALRFDWSRNRSLFEGAAEDQRSFVQSILHGSSFAAMHFYDRDRKSVLQVSERLDPDLERILDAEPHEFPLPGKHHHQLLRMDGKLFVRALVSLTDPGGSPFGYFEGVYLVPSHTVEAIRARVRDSLLTVLIVTTLASLALYPIIVSLNREALRLSQSLLESVVELLRVLGSAIAKRDSDTDQHNYRVTLYAIRLSEAVKRPPLDTASLIAGAFLHDVGKIGIPDGILLKPGRLTEEEFRIMQTHVTLGEDIVRESQWLAQAREVVACHHERYDGSGYPNRLAGDAIPFNARLFAIADVFDALTSERPYKEPMPLEQALAILRKESGRHFDPELLSVFETIVEDCLARYGQAGEAFLKSELARSVNAYFPILHDAPQGPERRCLSWLARLLHPEANPSRKTLRSH